MIEPGIGLITVSLVNIIFGSVLFLRTQLEELNPSNRYLSAFFVIIGIYGLTFYSIWYASESWPIVFLFGHAAPLYYLAGPLAWFYVRGTIRDQHKLSRFDLLHFLPFLIHVVNLTPFYLSNIEYKFAIAEQILENPSHVVHLDISLIYPTYLNYIFRPLIGIMYAGYSFWVLIKSFAPFRALPKYTFYLKGWMLAFVVTQILMFVTIGIFHLALQIQYSANNTLNRDSTFLIVTGLSYLLLSITPLIFSNLLYGNVESYPGSVAEEVGSHKLNPKDAVSLGVVPALVTSTRLEEIETMIDVRLKEDPIYLKPDFSIQMLATEIQIPIHHLNFFFKYFKEEKFTDFKARIRVNYALQIQSRSRSSYYSIKELAAISGYTDQKKFVEDFRRFAETEPKK
jgi:AraC-like DNA-binding protein